MRRVVNRVQVARLIRQIAKCILATVRVPIVVKATVHLVIVYFGRFPSTFESPHKFAKSNSHFLRQARVVIAEFALFHVAFGAEAFAVLVVVASLDWVR